jgi:hypothetical protein
MATDLSRKFAEITSMASFCRLVGTAPSDTYESTPEAEGITPLVRDFAAAVVGLGVSDQAGKTWGLTYDARYRMRLQRVAEIDENNRNIAVHGYGLTISDDKTGHSILDVRCYRHENMRDSADISHEFRVDVGGGVQARQVTALHEQFFIEPFIPVVERGLQKKLAAAAPVAA